MQEISETIALRDILEAAGEPIHSDGRTAFVKIPEGYRLQSLAEFDDYPATMKQVVTCNTIASFIDYMNSMKPPLQHNRKIIFASIGLHAASLLGLLDWHGTQNGIGAIGRCQFGARYNFPQTPEWTKWVASNGHNQTQEEFALFIEEHAPEFQTPTAADMLELAMTMEATTTAEFGSAVRLDNGQRSFRYAENIEAKAGKKGELTIPEKFTIGIAPFLGGPAYKVEARLQFRLHSGKLSFRYELVRPHEIIEAAARDAIAKVAESTKIMILEGNL